MSSHATLSQTLKELHRPGGRQSEAVHALVAAFGTPGLLVYYTLGGFYGREYNLSIRKFGYGAYGAYEAYGGLCDVTDRVPARVWATFRPFQPLNGHIGTKSGPGPPT